VKVNRKLLKATRSQFTFSLSIFTLAARMRAWRWAGYASHFIRRTVSHVQRDLCASSGQSAVEFTLVFLLFLVIVFIPADFGLAFYTAQLAQNASREATRIAAADPNLTNATCTLPCSSATSGTPLKAAADRVSQALLPDATISITLDPAAGTNCNRLASVSISGNYTFFFYRLLQTLDVPSASISGTATISRSTSMRWEHQPSCAG
jgi:Flp pilus assembly protein TadG